MTVFVAVGEEASFAGGARRLGISAPAVTRAIAALETRLGVKLLNRNTRFVRVTEAGQRYLDDARRVIAEADAADEAAAGISAEPRGHLAVTAPVLFGKMFILPGILEYLRRHPGMEVSAVFLDRVVNLLEEGFDAGVRIGQLPDSGMNAVRVGEVRRVVCAAPAYLEQHGTPRTPAELAQHTVVAATGVTPGVEWKFALDGTLAGVRIKPRLTVNTNDAAMEAARDGYGLTRLMSYQAAALLASGALVTVLDEFEPPRLPIHIIHREGRHASAKLRSFVDLMVSRLRGDASIY